MDDFFRATHPEFIALLHAMLALFLGGVVGWEREVAGKWAGFRTHMMVCLAAMLFVKVGQFLILDSQELLNTETLRVDPVRIIEAIVTGIAFLGAGTVFRDKDAQTARGLTTAASLLVVAPIGISIAIERYVLAIGTTVLALVVLRVMRWFEPSPETAAKSE